MKHRMIKLFSVALLTTVLGTVSICHADIQHLQAVPERSLSDEKGESPDAGYIDAVNTFSAELANAYILTNPGKNTLISPLSVRYAFSTLAEGAKGQTKTDLEGFLHAGIDETYRHQTLRHKLYLEETGRENDSSFMVKDSIWVDDGIAKSVRKDYIQTAADFYLAESYTADLGAEATANAMNEWVRKATNGLIEANHAADPSDVLLILNTLYFKSGWKEAFEEKNNYESNFYPDDDRRQKAVFMYNRLEDESYCQTDDYTIAELGFQNGFRFSVLLPNGKISLSSLLSEEKAKNTIDALLRYQPDQLATINWAVPQYDFKTEIDLLQLLESMGYFNVLSDDADYSGIADAPLVLSGARHLTNFILDNKGVEAAAYTEIKMAGAAPSKDTEKKTINMILDKPFLYSIKAPDGTVIFVGTMYEVGE